MKKLVLSFTIFLMFGVFLVNAQQTDTLNNEIIISLTKMNLPPLTIISKIQTSVNSFDVSVNALIKLQSNGVNGDVINEMIKVNNDAKSRTAKDMNSKNPGEMHRPGIYYYQPQNADNPLKQVNPTVTAGTKTGGFGTALAQSYSYGIAKNKLKSCLAGEESHLQIVNGNPEFYFYFANDANPNADSWFFATATSPNEFVCVKFKIRSDEREMEVGSSNAYGSSTGIPNKIKVKFDYEQVADGIFKVVFNEPLEQGEYCFVYASEVPTRFSNNKVFDFGINIEE